MIRQLCWAVVWGKKLGPTFSSFAEAMRHAKKLTQMGVQSARVVRVEIREVEHD